MFFITKIPKGQCWDIRGIRGFAATNDVLQAKTIELNTIKNRSDEAPNPQREARNEIWKNITSSEVA